MRRPRLEAAFNAHKKARQKVDDEYRRRKIQLRRLRRQISAKRAELADVCNDLHISLSDADTDDEYELVEYFRDSTLLSRDHQGHLIDWYGDPSTRWAPLYIGSRDGFTGEAFHSRVDGRGETFCVVRASPSRRRARRGGGSSERPRQVVAGPPSEDPPRDGSGEDDAEDFLFGGYTAIPWQRSGGEKYDDATWLFSMRNPYGVPPVRFPKRYVDVGEDLDEFDFSDMGPHTPLSPRSSASASTPLFPPTPAASTSTTLDDFLRQNEDLRKWAKRTRSTYHSKYLCWFGSNDLILFDGCNARPVSYSDLGSSFDYVAGLKSVGIDVERVDDDEDAAGVAVAPAPAAAVAEGQEASKSGEEKAKNRDADGEVERRRLLKLLRAVHPQRFFAGRRNFVVREIEVFGRVDQLL